MKKRNILGSILLILGIICGIYSIIFYLSYKKITLGIDIILIVSILFLIDGLLKINNKKKHVLLTYLEKIMDFIIIIVAFIFLTGEVLIQNGRFKETEGSSGIMVIIGYTDHEDEETINDRIDRAYEIYQEEKELPIIIVSNNTDKNKEYDQYGIEIREKLYEKGMDRFSIKLENKEYTILENLKSVKKFWDIKNENFYNNDRIKMVTSDYNVFLTSFIGQEMGLNIQVESVHTPFLKAPQVHVQEYFAIYKTFFFELIPYMQVR
ncbi:ElyC/SanA/YdcF family protein [Oceanirhabdus seepicola]|uniref:YdcF family protein n=1 Tax=Oceanirhabdus seepicola TaxID=2828781 RepID=A0A9J6P3V2_9CLOT|nr:ElyC/SanA/YdcF family protein [Oceanirhabdus seepicola]MCM1991012.1 YdcF family protein [Oceanirhabdus seepicola]